MEFALEQDNQLVLSEKAIDMALENISIAIEDINDLFRYIKITEATETISDVSKVFLKQTLESFYARYDYEVPISISTEAFDNDTKNIALEGFKDFILSIWEGIKNTFKAIWNYISNIFNSSKAKTEKAIAQTDKLKQKCEKMSKAPQGVDPVIHKQKLDNPPKVVVDNLNILKVFGNFKGEIKHKDFLNCLDKLEPLSVTLIDILDALKNDCDDIEKFVRKLNSVFANMEDAKPYINTLNQHIKFKTNDVISNRFNKIDIIPEAVADRLGLVNADTKLYRVDYSLADGVVSYFIKPLEVNSFYKATLNNELTDKVTAKMYLYSLNEIIDINEKCNKLLKLSLANADTFKKDAENLISKQKTQGEVLDKSIKYMIEDKKQDGFDAESVRTILMPVAELHRQTGLLAKQLAHMYDRLPTSASRYVDVANHLVNELHKTTNPPKEENNK